MRLCPLIRERVGSKALILPRTEQIPQGHSSGNGFWGIGIIGMCLKCLSIAQDTQGIFRRSRHVQRWGRLDARRSCLQPGPISARSARYFRPAPRSQSFIVTRSARYAGSMAYWMAKSFLCGG
jgi:hypothetical protein